MAKRVIFAYIDKKTIIIDALSVWPNLVFVVGEQDPLAGRVYWLTRCASFAWTSLRTPMANLNGHHNSVKNACESVKSRGTIFQLDSMAELADYLPEE